MILTKLRKCRSCGFRGYMLRWISNSTWALVLLCVLTALGIIPGLVFYFLNREKLLCPECGAPRK